MSLPSTHSYETIYVLKPSISDADFSAINQKVDNVVTKFEGKLVSRDDWGNREMAYPIDDNTNGRYCLIQYNGNRGVVEEIERHFKISADVIRFITVALSKTYDYEKLKKQMLLAEEEMVRNRELRRKGPSSY